MRGVIRFFLNNAVAANLLMVFILFMGYFGLSQIKTTFFPERESKNISIQCVYPGASPQEMEEGIVSKIEEQLVGVNGVKQTTSVSQENFASVNIEVEKNSSTDLVLQDVKSTIDAINSFPASMEPPTIYKREQLGEAYIFALSGDVDLRNLKEYAEDIEDDLLAIDGISQVDMNGFPPQEIEIAFREKEMRALDISFDEAVRAVSGNNLLSTGGSIKTNQEEYLIRAENKNYFASDLAEIVVRSGSNGGLVKLGQIASVVDRWEDSPQRSYVNGNPAVALTVYNTLEEDMFSNVENTKAYLKTWSESHPNINIAEIRDGKKYLNGRIEFIKKNGLIGFLIVLVLLAMFLNIRLAFWVALAIPICFAGMFAIAPFLGTTVNVITTFGMVVVIGILVDDGIVIAENIFQHYERGKTAMDAAIDGTMEVLPAVTSAIITTVIAFSTFYFMPGIGDFFSAMSTVVILTLVFSLIEGVFILPAHVAHSKALKQTEKGRITKFFDSIMDFLKEKFYGPLLKLCMDYPVPAVVLCISMLLVTLGAFQGGSIGGTFFPNVQQDDFRISVEMPAGAHQSQVTAVLDSIERCTWLVNNDLSEDNYTDGTRVIEKIVKEVGPSSNQGSLRVFMISGEERPNLKNFKVTQAIRNRLGNITGVDKLVFGMGNIFGDPVSVSLLSKNSNELDAAVSELKSQMESINAIADIEDSNKQGLKELVIDLKPLALSLGFNISDIMRSVRQGFFGAEVQRLQRGSDEVKVWVRYEDSDRSSISDLLEMRIRSNDGRSLPLGQLISLSEKRGVVSLNHNDGQREVRVTADITDPDVSISNVNADITSVILPPILNKYPSVRVGMEGQARQAREMQESMGQVVPILLLMMFFVVVLTFGSISQAMIVFAILPFAFVGVGFGHWLMDKPVSMLSILGVIALIGIFINDSLVFVSAFNKNIKEGLLFKEALYKTGLSRFRPITLTTITTVAGLLPLMLERSVQAQFLIPMAISVAFGLIIGTFIILVMLPALLTIASGIRVQANQFWTGIRENGALLEPSYPHRKHPWWVTAATSMVFAILLGGLVAATLQITGKLV